MNCCNDFGECTQGDDCPVRGRCKEHYDWLTTLAIAMWLASISAIVGFGLAFWMYK